LIDNEYVLVNKRSGEGENWLGWLPKVEILEGLKKDETIYNQIMNFKLILNIAFHLLKARLKQTVVAAVGWPSLFIALVSFMNGLNELLDGLMLTERHVRLYNEVKPAENQPLILSL
jgi:hypothetical protein